MLFKLDESEEAKDLIEKSNYLYIHIDGKYFIVGDDALKICNAIGKGDVIRPMQNGLLNPSLKESTELLFFILKSIVGEPIIENEPLRFTVPANPIDQDFDNTFHKSMIQNFFEKLGYNVKPINEALCVCFSENPIMKSTDGDIPFSGITISCGAGMWNIALCFKGMQLVEFSCTKSGDYLDEQASKVSGISKGKIIKLKETKLDLNNVDFSNRGLASLSIYYDEMIERIIKLISNNFKDKSSEMDGQIEIILAGGTSMPSGFCERFNKKYNVEKLPFDIYQIRQATEPFYSVVHGATLRAISDSINTKKEM
jgi:hypothetical protein